MNTPPANPFTGLKGALAGLMSGGWLGLLLSLLFRRKIAPMLEALESLFGQFKAGTLPLAPAPIPAPAARAATRPSAPRAPRLRPASRRKSMPRATPLRAQRPASPPIRDPQPGLSAAPAVLPSRLAERCIHKPQQPDPPKHALFVPL